jgi:hypothetical protein
LDADLGPPLHRRHLTGFAGAAVRICGFIVALGLIPSGCDETHPTFGGAKIKGRRLVRAEFQLTDAHFSDEEPGYDAHVICGIVSANGPHGPLRKVEFIANGDQETVVIDDQALSFDPRSAPSARNDRATDVSADCAFPQIWKAMCRQPLSGHLFAQEKRCPP